MKRYKIIVAGRVQGVGFRYFVQKQAQLNCIKGFVRNLYDGNVEIDAEGDSTNLQDFIHQCKQGPAHSSVDFFTQSEVPLWGYQNFNIR
jgi:acylphosphatase